jgi:peptidoglycan/LPS O-acetylase OafA/YrhL
VPEAAPGRAGRPAAGERGAGGDRLLELDGIRALAVLAVIADHLLVFALQVREPAAALFFWLGLAGVRYFFVLSGFVIARRLLAEHARTRTISLQGFWRRRAFRILPACWAYLGVVALLAAAGWIRANGASLAWSALFVANLKPVDWFHDHIWSLSVEEQFYLLAPLGALALLGRRRIWSAAVLAAVFLGCLFWHRLEHALAYAHVTARLEFLSQFRFIICGVLPALFAEKLTPWLRAWAGGWVAALAAVTALMRDMPVHYWEKIALQCLQPLAIAAVIGWIAVNGGRCSWLRQGVLQWIGRRSYSLYLWQQLFLCPAGAVRFAISPLLRVCSVPLTFAASALSYRFIERPLNRVGHGGGSVEAASRRVSPG